MELQSGELPSWDRSPVAFMRTCAVSQSLLLIYYKDVSLRWENKEVWAKIDSHILSG